MDLLAAWPDARVKEAAARLAMRATINALQQEKSALDWNSVGQWVSQHKPLAYGAIGAAGGGLLGGLSSLHQDPEERQPWRSALSGAIAGGALGLGGGMLHNSFAAQPPEQMTDEIRHTIDAGDPKAVEQLAQAHPGLVDQMKQYGNDVHNPPSAISQGMGQAAAHPGYAAAGGLGGGMAGARTADRLFAPDRHVPPLQRGANAVNLDNYKLPNGEKGLTPAGDLVQDLRTGRISPEMQKELLQDVRPRRVVPPQGEGWVPPGRTLGYRKVPQGFSPQVPGVLRDEVRTLEQSAPALRAGKGMRRLGAGVGGLLGGVGAAYLPDLLQHWDTQQLLQQEGLGQ